MNLPQMENQNKDSESPPLRKQIEGLMESKMISSEKLFMLYNLLHKTPFFINFRNSYQNIDLNLNFILAVCDILKLEKYETQKNLFDEKENSQDFVFYVIEGSVDLCHLSTKKNAKTKERKFQNGPSGKENSSERRRKKSAELKQKSRVLQNPHLIPFAEFALTNKRMFDRVEKHLENSKINSKKFNEKKGRLKSSFMIKFYKLNEKDNRHKLSLFLDQNKQTHLNLCKMKKKYKIENQILKEKSVFSNRSSVIEPNPGIKCLVFLRKVKEGQCFGEFLQENEVRDDLIALTAKNSFILSVKKTQIYKILSIIRGDQVIGTKQIFLDAIFLKPKLPFGRELDYFLACFTVI